VRIIAATNKNLPDSIKKGLFREDLYYRLNVIPIELKPLRERRQDIGILAKYFIERMNKKEGAFKKLSSEALTLLGGYSWPGNIRELDNAINRAHILADTDVITPDLFHLGSYDENDFCLPEFVDGFNLENHIEKYRDALIEKALSHAKNQHEAAQMLGVTDAALSKRKKKN
jgi:two-component system NtrC family response regulator